MALTAKQIYDLNNSMEAMQRAQVGTLLASVETDITALEAAVAAPALGTATLDGTKKIITVPCTKLIYNATADTAALKAKVTASTNGTTFSALGASDTVTIDGLNLIVTFDAALTTATNIIKVGADAVMNAVGIKNIAYTSNTLSAA